MYAAGEMRIDDDIWSECDDSFDVPQTEEIEEEEEEVRTQGAQTRHVESEILRGGVTSRRG